MHVILKILMKKLILSSLLGLGISTGTIAGSVEHYVELVDQANVKFQKENRQFLRALNPQQTAFTGQQHQQYCAIVQRYVDGLYMAVERNSDIFQSQKAYTKADVINEVLSKREMQTLERYGVKCDLH